MQHSTEDDGSDPVSMALRERIADQVPDEVDDLRGLLDTLAVENQGNSEVTRAIARTRLALDELSMSLIRAHFDAQNARRPGHR